MTIKWLEMRRKQFEKVDAVKFGKKLFLLNSFAKSCFHFEEGVVRLEPPESVTRGTNHVMYDLEALHLSAE